VLHNRSSRTLIRLRHATRCRVASLGTLRPVLPSQWRRCPQDFSPPSANAVALRACRTQLWRLRPPDGHPPFWPLAGALPPRMCLEAVARVCPRFLNATASAAAPTPREIPPSCRPRAAPPVHPSHFPLATDRARVGGLSGVMELSRPPTSAHLAITAARSAASRLPHPHPRGAAPPASRSFRSCSQPPASLLLFVL